MKKTDPTAFADEVLQRSRGKTTDGTRWEVVARAVPTRLCPAVPLLEGFDETTPSPVARTEFRPGEVVMIIELGPVLHVDGRPTDAGRPSPGGFVAGLGLRPVDSAHEGSYQGLELKLPPTAAHRLFGAGAVDWATGLQSLSDVVGTELNAEALGALPSWGARLARLEQWVAERWRRGPRLDQRIVWAEGEMRRYRGRVSIRSLHQQLEMSERYFIDRFRSVVGVSPKRYARTLRLAHVVDLFWSSDQSLAAIACQVGCADQSHLSREVRTLTGVTATELRRMLPNCETAAG